jgi:hypothetical protein
MKKVFLFAAAAAALAACSDEELSTQSQVLTSNEAPVNFSVYTERGLTRGGGQAGDLNNENIGANGFGVFAYYTAGEQYDAKATPNFMYNQKVTCTGTATAGTLWTYEPVKYWPNEYGDKAISDETDYLTFFAYAPWTNVEPTTGNIVPTKSSTADAETVEHQQKYNIVSVNKNNATGDPIVKYVVDTDPATSVDLLWGVAAETAGDNYSPIDGKASLTEGGPFLNLVKPNNPQSDRLQFNLKHALAKVKVTIDYIADDFTPTGTSKVIDAKKTRIFVRSFKMSGFATKGALNLNNTVPGQPLWKDFDGSKDLAFDEVTYQDGRKDGKEGETNGAQNNETPQGLNPNIVENYAQTTGGEFGTDKTSGVTNVPQLLFGGNENENNGYFYVIPRNEENNKVDVTIAYDVETIDPALAGKLSDNETHGISIENIISKADIFGGMDFMAGYQYEINIHLGMTSVKVEATVTDWQDNGKTNVDLPDNQQMAATTAINYNYADNYTYNGNFYASDNEVVYVSASTTPDVNMLNDLARFLGALHRAAGVSEIEYNSKKYIWDPARIYELGLVQDPDATELKGSNWINADDQTLVSVISADVQGGSVSGKLTFKADNDEMTIYLGKANYSFDSFVKQGQVYNQLASGTVFAFEAPVTINQIEYRKVLVLTNDVASFVGKFYYVEKAATAGTDKWELFDQFGNGLGIYVTITALP